MRFLWNDPDGGAESNSRMWGIECKGLGSLLVLSFTGYSREAFHTHAFNSVSWLLSGRLVELLHSEAWRNVYVPSLRPIITRRSTFHMVHSLLHGKELRSWVITVRGPWANTWREFRLRTKRFVTLTHGRKELP